MTELNAKRDDVPDVSSAGMNTSAKMIWQAIQARPRFNRDSTVGKFRGIPGWYWTGAVNQVINDLWPALNDRMLTEKEEAELIKLALNRFLRHNQAIVCTRDGGLVKPSLWFVARHWPELTVTPGTREKDDLPVTDEAAIAVPSAEARPTATPLDVFKLSQPPAPAVAATQEERSEEEMTPTFKEPVIEPAADEDDDVVYHACRKEGCDEKFEGIHHRATHEMRHGFRYNEDGTVTTFDPNDPVPDEEAVQDLIVKVCKDTEPMNTAQIVEAVRKLVPKAASPTIKIVLQVLADDKWFEIVSKVEGQKGRVRKFKFLGEPKRAKKSKTVAQAVEEKVDSMTNGGGFLETAVATLRSDTDSSRVERYQELFQELLKDLADLDSLREALAAKDAELAAEKAKNADLQRNIDAVLSQRDELQGKLDTLKSVFGSALQ